MQQPQLQEKTIMICYIMCQTKRPPSCPRLVKQFRNKSLKYENVLITCGYVYDRLKWTTLNKLKSKAISNNQ
jgi:hypothetical protein